MEKPLRAAFEKLSKDRTPSSWLKATFNLNSERLYDFLRVFYAKYDFLRELIYTRKCEMFPIVPLGKLFDPFAFLHSFLWEAAFEQKVFCSPFFVLTASRYLFGILSSN
jgi:hypothetical protein